MKATDPDRFASARAVADAVLYEGYVLYPYRASSRKNQVRWQFGVLTPRAYSESDGFERWSMRTECLVDPGRDPKLSVRIRCLQVQHRGVEVVVTSTSGEDDPEFAPTDILRVGASSYVDWDEAVEQTVDLAPMRLSALRGAPHDERFELEGGSETELVRSPGSEVAGRIVRQRRNLSVRVLVDATEAVAAGEGGKLVKVGVTVENLTVQTAPGGSRDEVMAYSLVAVHTMLALDDGVFLSLLDPPEDARGLVAGCRNEGTFPVLVGSDDIVLSSPIILYDHPEIAQESPGDLYDSTEIDEIHALRVLTLTDEEKAEARATDPRAAAIIDRCDDMPPEIWSRLHGAMRSLEPLGDPEPNVAAPAGLVEEPAAWWDPQVDASFDPWSDSVTVAGVPVTKGAAVRLRPSRRSDAQDLFLQGLRATVAGVFADVDGEVHVAVTVDDDPATEELSWQGRYLFFYPDEVEPLTVPGGSR